MSRKILAIAEHADGRINPVTHELASFASELADLCDAEIEIVVLGQEVSKVSREISRRTGLNVTAILVPGLRCYNSLAYVSILSDFLASHNPLYTCCAHTSQGMDFAPALAAKIRAVCISGVEQLTSFDGQLCVGRSMFGGRVIATVMPKRTPAVITVQPGSFSGREVAIEGGGVETTITVPFTDGRYVCLGEKTGNAIDSSLAEAAVVVGAGRGVAAKETLALIERLASYFSGSAVAGSRPVCDMGWLPYRKQVGLTGATISPKLYIAAGISGSSQHLAGIREAEFIVAINKDPRASIFNIADVCVVEDLTRFIPELISQIEKVRRRGGDDVFPQD